MTFKNRMRKVVFGLLALFVAMFLLRLIFGFTERPGYPETFSALNNFVQSEGSANPFRSLANIASAKYEVKKGDAGDSQVISVDQKYEKTADFQCKTNQFAEEEKTVNQIIESNNALIQFQQKSGIAGDRFLYLQIGVQPEKFDQFVDQVQEQTSVVSLEVTKKDKTNEYRELNARISTLQTTRQALVDLKNKGGKIEEYVDLENRILDIDGELQQLGVQLGSFDSENEFCTVKISLREGKVAKVSLTDQLRSALEWTIEYYLMLILALCGALIAAYLLLTILDKFKVIAGIQEKLES